MRALAGQRAPTPQTPQPPPAQTASARAVDFNARRVCRARRSRGPSTPGCVDVNIPMYRRAPNLRRMHRPGPLGNRNPSPGPIAVTNPSSAVEVPSTTRRRLSLLLRGVGMSQARHSACTTQGGHDGRDHSNRPPIRLFSPTLTDPSRTHRGGNRTQWSQQRKRAAQLQPPRGAKRRHASHPPSNLQ